MKFIFLGGILARKKFIVTGFVSDLITICIFISPIALILKFIADNSEIFSNIFLLVILAVALITLLFFIYYIYSSIYFLGKRFTQIKNSVSEYIQDWNNLNKYIDELKINQFGLNQLKHGTANLEDNSKWKYSRKELKSMRYAPNIYYCSRSVCSSASKEPFKYICKYFKIIPSADSLEKAETMLNNFEAVNEGKQYLIAKKNSIYRSIEKDIPFLIHKFSKGKLNKELGFEYTDFHDIYYPSYIFKYISSGGNAGMSCKIVLDTNTLNEFIVYLSNIVKFKKSIAGQRALMTSRLRHYILERDNYTCKLCGNSTKFEPNLLLEIDHIIPVSKGGLTELNNLQTLCWRCNRAKGANIPQ